MIIIDSKGTFYCEQYIKYFSHYFMFVLIVLKQVLFNNTSIYVNLYYYWAFGIVNNIYRHYNVHVFSSFNIWSIK